MQVRTAPATGRAASRGLKCGRPASSALTCSCATHPPCPPHPAGSARRGRWSSPLRFQSPGCAAQGPVTSRLQQWVGQSECHMGCSGQHRAGRAHNRHSPWGRPCTMHWRAQATGAAMAHASARLLRGRPPYSRPCLTMHSHCTIYCSLRSSAAASFALTCPSARLVTALCVAGHPQVLQLPAHNAQHAIDHGPRVGTANVPLQRPHQAVAGGGQKPAVER